MKKNTVTLMLLAAIGFGGLTVKAQTAEQKAWIVDHYNQEEVQKFQSRLEDEYKDNYTKTLEAARQNGWPLTIDKPNGYTSILVGVNANGTPRYIMPMNKGAAKTARVTPINTGGELFLDLNGQDMTVGIWEPGRVRSGHVDLQGRVTVADGANWTSPSSNNLHATHVSATMMGNGTGNINNRGLAFQANLLAHDAVNDLGEAFASATNPNTALLVSNHSYGLDKDFVEAYMYGAYTQASAAWDEVAFNAPYYQSVWAAGNDRIGEQRDLLVEEGTAKNTVVVAATTEMVGNEYSGPNSVTMSSFSNYGPTDDRRIKPDIATKGVDVTSASDASATAYATLQGTSMASPGVAASLLLMQQQYREINNGAFMRAATLKGLMTHTADELGTAPGPDHRFGWGLINTAKAVLLIDDAKNAGTAIINENILEDGEVYTLNVTASGTEPLKVSIAWTDRPGPINNGQANNTNPALINNLDVKVTKDGQDFFPWKLDSTSGTPAVKGKNDVDNIEVVEISPAAGNYTITVSNDGTLFNFQPQRYSLIISGITGALSAGQSNELNGNIAVYPNPATDVINIGMDKGVDTSDCTVSLYDIQGRQVKRFDTFIESINVSDLSAGVYMLNINRNGSVTSKKIIIK